jgi:hypothetical protein
MAGPGPGATLTRSSVSRRCRGSQARRPRHIEQFTIIGRRDEVNCWSLRRSPLPPTLSTISTLEGD